MCKESVMLMLLDILNKVTVAEGKKTFNAEIIDVPLLGDTIGLGSMELVYLYLEVVDHFHLTFTAEELEKGTFFTLASIGDAICRKQGIT